MYLERTPKNVFTKTFISLQISFNIDNFAFYHEQMHYSMKNFILSILCLFITVITFGQALESSYENVFSGEYVYLEEIHIDDQQNFYVSGSATGPFNIGLETSETFLESSYRELFVGKYNSSNELLWYVFLDGTTSSNQVRGITTDAQGGVYVTGSFGGTLQFTEDGQNELTSFGSTSMYLAKYSSSGEFLWTFKVGESNWAQYSDNIDIVNNKIALTMVFTGTVDVDPSFGTVNISGNSSDAFLEYSLDGDYLSHKIYGGSSFLRDIEYREDGSFVTVGSFGSSGFDIDFNGTTNVSAGGFSSNAFVASYDNNNDLLWYKAIGAAFGSNLMYQVETNSKNEVIVACVFDRVDIGGEEADGELYIVKYNAEGDMLDFLKLSSNLGIINMAIDSEDRIWLVNSFSEEFVIESGDDQIIYSPVEDFNNRSLMIFDDEFNYVTGDQISSDRFWASKLILRDTDEAIICNSVTSDGNLFYGTDNEGTITGTDNITIQSISLGGCTSSLSNVQAEICSGETYTFGPIDISESGTYENLLINADGCDSIVTLSLTVIDADVDINVEENFLFTSIIADSYQWYDCLDNMEIVGETEKEYYPLSSGSYYVEVEVAMGQCKFISECQEVVISSNDDILLQSTKLYPNPVNNQLFIDNDSHSFVSVAILSIDGKTVIKNDIILSSSFSLDVSKLLEGLYYVKLISTDGKTLNKRMIKS